MGKAGKRAVRYLLPSCIVGFLLDIAQRGLAYQDLPGAFVRHLFVPSAGYWYLVALAIFNFSLIPFLLNKRRSLLLDALLAAAFYALFTVGWRCGGSVGAAFNMEHCATYYPFFVCGFLSRRHGWVDWLMRHAWAMPLAAIAYALLLPLHVDWHLLDNVCRRFVLPLCGTAVMLYVFGSRERKASPVERVLGYFGRNSLFVYLVHFFFLPHIQLLPWMQWFQATGNTFLEVCLTVALALAMAAASIAMARFFTTSRFVRDYVLGEFVNRIK